MPALRTNILANYAGQFWMVVMGVAFLPLYIHLLGLEAFGLVGLMLSFQSIMQLLDFGLGGATNRELSRRVHHPEMASGLRDLVRSAEILIWMLAGAVALLIGAISIPLAEQWLHLESLTPAHAGRAIAIMGASVALLWPSIFYAQCLSGLERQPTLNVINAIFATLRYAGVIPVLLWIAPTIETFLWWHVLIGALQSSVTALTVWRNLPSSDRGARWSLAELCASRRFASGLFAIGILALMITQLDRLTIATMLPLEQLGYYTLAVSVAAGLGKMVQPVFNAIYPRFSRLIARHDLVGLTNLYHISSQFLTVIVASASAVLLMFAHDVLFLWTGDMVLAGKVTAPLSLLVAGTALNGLINTPYALQLAHGWTRLTIKMNLVGLLVGLPLCLWAVQSYGLVGASLPWLAINCIFVFVGLPLMHRRLLPGELRTWYLHDVGPSFVAAMLAAGTMRLIIPPLSRTIFDIALLGLASGFTFLSAALVAPVSRRWLINNLLRSP